MTCWHWLFISIDNGWVVFFSILIFFVMTQFRSHSKDIIIWMVLERQAKGKRKTNNIDYLYCKSDCLINCVLFHVEINFRKITTKLNSRNNQKKHQTKKKKPHIHTVYILKEKIKIIWNSLMWNKRLQKIRWIAKILANHTNILINILHFCSAFFVFFFPFLSVSFHRWWHITVVPVVTMY